MGVVMSEAKPLSQIAREEGIKFLAVGIVTACLTAWWQYTGWYRDTTTRRLEKNVENALKAYDDVILLASERWYRSYRVTQAVKTPPKDYDERASNYIKALAEWNIKSDLMITRLELFSDRPAGYTKPVSLRDIGKADCNKSSVENYEGLDGKAITELDPRSLKTRFIFLSHCYRQYHDGIRELMSGVENGRQTKPSAEVDALLKTVTKQGDDLFTHANVMRSAIISEAAKLRSDNSALKFIPSSLVKSVYGQQ
jgi:hypothetical protein